MRIGEFPNSSRQKRSRESIVLLPGRGHQGPEQRKVAPVRLGGLHRSFQKGRL